MAEHEYTPEAVEQVQLAIRQILQEHGWSMTNAPGPQYFFETTNAAITIVNQGHGWLDWYLFQRIESPQEPSELLSGQAGDSAPQLARYRITGTVTHCVAEVSVLKEGSHQDSACLRVASGPVRDVVPLLINRCLQALRSLGLDGWPN